MGTQQNAFPSGTLTSFWFSAKGFAAVIMAFLRTVNAVVLTTGGDQEGNRGLNISFWETIWISGCFKTKTGHVLSASQPILIDLDGVTWCDWASWCVIEWFLCQESLFMLAWPCMYVCVCVCQHVVCAHTQYFNPVVTLQAPAHTTSVTVSTTSPQFSANKFHFCALKDRHFFLSLFCSHLSLSLLSCSHIALHLSAPKTVFCQPSPYFSSSLAYLLTLYQIRLWQQSETLWHSELLRLL